MLPVYHLWHTEKLTTGGFETPRSGSNIFCKYVDMYEHTYDEMCCPMSDICQHMSAGQSCACVGMRKTYANICEKHAKICEHMQKTPVHM